MKWWLGIVVGLSSAASAAPTYLSCSVVQDGQPLAVEVTVDEADQRAIVLLPSTGRAVTKTALFAPDEVRIPDGPSTWIVNRVSLVFQRIFVVGEKQWIDAGKCQIKTAPAARAF